MISMNVMNYQEPVLRNVSTLLEAILANVILIFTKKSLMVKLANVLITLTHGFCSATNITSEICPLMPET
jgi:hypothetical protein